MTNTRYIRNLIVDILIGVLMLVIVIGAVIVTLPASVPSNTSAAQNNSTTQAMVLLPVEQSTPTIALQNPSITGNMPNKPAALGASRVTSNQTVAIVTTPKAADYLGVFAVTTAVAGFVGIINYVASLVYRIGLPKL